MNPKRLADALNTMAMGFAEAAEALSDTPAAVGSPGQGREVQPAPPGSPAPSFDELPPEPYGFDESEHGPSLGTRQPQPSLADESTDFAPQGSLAVCPKHHVPYADGRYGPFCKSLTDDEAWGKKKPDGKVFCSITPKNAAEWLRQQAAVVTP